MFHTFVLFKIIIIVVIIIIKCHSLDSIYMQEQIAHSWASDFNSLCFEELYLVNVDLLDKKSLFPEDWNITFNLFAPNDPNKQIVLNFTANDTTIKSSGFDPSLRTKFIVHGWTSGFYNFDLFNRQWMKDMKDYILAQTNCNVICVDWSKPASDANYLKVFPRTPIIGQMISNFIKRLINVTNISTNDIHCIGHSLGAHICGYTGKNFGSNKLAQITGLDPAGPGFDALSYSTDVRSLNFNDANLVVVMHTSSGFRTFAGFNPAGFMALPNSLGHYDFRINGDLNFALFCPHDTAYKYSIVKPENDCQFIAFKCINGQDFDGGLCAQEAMPLELNFNYYDNPNNKLNETIPPNNLFIKLGDSYPYCLFHYQIVVEVEEWLALETKLTLFGRKQVNIEMKLWPKNDQNIYYYLYTDVEELGTVPEVQTNGENIRSVSVNYMSHIDKSVRKERSSKPRVIQNESNESLKTSLFDWFKQN